MISTPSSWSHEMDWSVWSTWHDAKVGKVAAEKAESLLTELTVARKVAVDLAVDTTKSMYCVCVVFCCVHADSNINIVYVLLEWFTSSIDTTGV